MILMKKRMLSKQYKSYFSQSSLANYINEPEYANANFWLNAIELPTKQDRDAFLQQANQAGIMTRPAWTPMHSLDMYKNCLKVNLCNTEWIEERLVNLPSSII